ncbi:MAG: DNA/RNA non-specific endonuclease [Propionibacteriaceae bacterium]|nr:DNA/RNA non-specific endonuclease [Propionibacteriaceae bacterium]
MAKIPASAGSKIVREFVEKLVVKGKRYVPGNPVKRGKVPKGFGKLEPDAVYTAGRRGAKDMSGRPIKYVYQTDHLGRITKAHARPLQRPATKLPRGPHNRRPAGKRTGDHAGHLFADIFGGSGRLDNIVAQLDDVNLSRMRTIENDWARRLDAGEVFDVDIDILYDKDGLRPTGFKITEIVDGKPGRPHHIRNS